MRTLFATSASLLALSILLGAFGAHGLEKLISPMALKTFHTGVHYHQLHALGLAILALYYRDQNLNIQFPISAIFLVVGILLFSGNCYLYAITGIKFFALIVPLGGTSFIVGWLWWLKDILKQRT
jgi:uncharacterized membrane protein YgdD (TMEM256/DUF423 family)